LSKAASVRVQGLARRFGPVTALDGVGFTAPAGELTCLIGPSGCGKTTLLRLIAGLDAPSEGGIEIDGQDVTRLSPAQRGAGMVFQSYALFPNMTVASNIAYGMKRGLSAQEKAARVDALLETVGLPGLGQRLPGALSGGQQQRVAIARALAPDPKILLLDEPLAALDPQIRERLRGELKSLQHRLGVTTIMVTHDQDEALAIADRIVVMRAGRIEQADPPETVYNLPASAFVAGFVGAANVIPAVVSAPGQIQLFGVRSLPAATGDFAIGARVTVCVRPEAVWLDQGEGRGVGARIVSRQFAGATQKLDAILEGVARGRVSLETPSDRPAPPIGALVHLDFPADRLRLFAGSEEVAFVPQDEVAWT